MILLMGRRVALDAEEKERDQATSNLIGMINRISAIVLTLLWLHSPIVFGQAHFKRFPETVTNNGAYVLGWGLKDDPAGSGRFEN
jgi:hypothetical protein